MDYLGKVRAEARDAYSWSNGPGDRYAEHQHAYTKLLYCTAGSIDFRLGDGRVVALTAGGRMVLPAGTPHSAVVGPKGCTCVEGKMTATDYGAPPGRQSEPGAPG